jgi:hypothetical protein
MAYQSSGLIQSIDFNNYVGSPTGTTPGTINNIWGTGNGKYGYGQPAISQVGTNDIVTSAQWTNLINAITKTSNHQGTSVTTIPLTDYEVGDIISTSLQGGTNSIFALDIAALNSKMNTAVAQGTNVTTTAVNTTPWSNQLIFLFTISFSGPDQARYFFNAGGQIAINLSHPTGSGINPVWNSLCAQTGTLIISSPNTGTVSIAGTNYTGFTKLGGGGGPLINTSNSGYYGLNSTWQNIFKQLGTSGLSQYLQSYVSVSAKTNGTRGGNGDAGSVINIAVKLDQVPDGGSTLLTSAGTSAGITMRYPSTSYLTSTWGTPIVTYQAGPLIAYGYV